MEKSHEDLEKDPFIQEMIRLFGGKENLMKAAIGSMNVKAAAEMQAKNRVDKKYIYFAIDTIKNTCKIGISADPKKRVQMLNVGNSNNIILAHTFEGKESDEKALHQKYNAWHIRGEWFEIQGNLRVFIDSVFNVA